MNKVGSNNLVNTGNNSSATVLRQSAVDAGSKPSIANTTAPTRRQILQAIASGVFAGTTAMLTQSVTAITAITAATTATGCGEPEETPAEKLADKFGQNFNPNDYTYFSDKAYKISNSRDPDPNSQVQCVDENKATMDTGELINYLIYCNSRQQVLDFFKRVTLDQSWNSSDKAATAAERDAKVKDLQAARSVKIDSIVIDDDLFKIWALLGKDPEMHLAFMKSVITYRGWDLNENDLFRNPVDTLRSGWADCDDWAVVHYFWAHLHRFNPNLVIAVKPESSGKISGSVNTVNAHTFVTYPNPVNGNLVVLDNQSFTELKPGETLEGYIAVNYPGKDLAIEFDGPFEG